MNLLFQIIVLLGATKSVKPSWISSPIEYCKSSEICTVGTGTTSARARADARAGIMRWFNTEIKASSRFEEETQDNIYSSKALTDVWEGTKGLLEGVLIKESFEDNGNHYSLASLDKTATANAIKLKIKQFDDKMKVLLKEKTKKSIKMLEENFKIREVLNAQHQFVAGTNIGEVVSYEQLINYRNSLVTLGLSYFIENKNTDARLIASLKEALTSTGNKVVNTDSFDRRIVISLKNVQQHLKVEGFVKYEFTLKIDCMEKEKIINSLTTTLSDSGRSLQHIQDVVIPKIRTYISENIYELL